MCLPTKMLNRFLLLEWTRGNLHKTDIEFNRFLAKVIGVETNDSSDMMASSIIRIIVERHLALCQQFTDRSEEFLKVRKWPGEAYTNWYSIVGDDINQLQLEHFKVEPLFRSLIIVADLSDCENNRVNDRGFEGDRTVKLVSTGANSGLSALIDLQVVRGTTFPPARIGQIEVVTTTMSEAIRFVMELEQRESAAFPRTDEKLRALDIGLDPEATATIPRPGEDDPTILEYAKQRWGYEGGELLRPSTTWIPQKETLVDFMRYNGLQSPIEEPIDSQRFESLIRGLGGRNGPSRRLIERAEAVAYQN